MELGCTLNTSELLNLILRPGQTKSIDLIKQNKNVLSVLPTGYGKTIIGMEAMKQSKSNGELGFFVSPLTALSNQLTNDLKDQGYHVLLDIGSKRVEDIADYNGVDAVVTTYERLDSILRSQKKVNSITRKLGYVVVDEIHNLGSKSRSQSIFSTIYKLKMLFSTIRFVGLSATIGNRDYVAKEINAIEVYVPPEERPIPLEKVYMPFEAINRVDEVRNKIQLLMGLMREDTGQCLVLVASKKLSKKLSSIFNQSGFKTAYHNANIPFDKRVKIEQEYKEGKYQALFCTTTLAMGMNLPADYVVVFDYKFWEPLLSQHVFMERSLLDQVIGRAGRPGITKREKAYAYFLVLDSEQSTLEQIMSETIVIKKVVDPKSIICDWLTAGIHSDVNDLVVELATQGEVPTKDIGEAIEYLREHHFVDVYNGEIIATKLGNLAAWFFVHPEVIVALQSLEPASDIEVLMQIFSRVKTLSEMIQYDPENDDSLVNQASALLKKLYPKADTMNTCFSKFVYYLFYNSFRTKDRDEEQDEVSYHGNSIGVELNRILSCSKIFVANKLVSQSIDNLLLMSKKHRLMTEDEVALANLKSIGDKRLEKLEAAHITNLKSFMIADNEKLSVILGLRTETVIKLKAGVNIV